jgi:monoamine oxidase
MPSRPSQTALTRRQFLWAVARLGGSVAGAMLALDLLGRDLGGRLRLAGRAPAGRRRVVILGAGMAGMATAYELGKLGYDCTVLEARARPGGRNWTVRGGTTETEFGREAQVCRFAEGLFMNPGPMRISHTHETTLSYCRELGVPLIPFINVNEAAYVFSPGFPRMRLREVHADWRGYTAELLAKVIRRDQLDVALSKDDREKLIEALRDEGNLNAALVFPRDGEPAGSVGSSDARRGYSSAPGAVGEAGVETVPLDLETLVKSGYGALTTGTYAVDQQPTMLTPAGGMDRIAYAFAGKLGGAIRHRALVKEIRRTPGGQARVVYADLAGGGALREVAADFCVCAMPPALLAQIPADFLPATAAAIAAPRPAAAGKIGLQFKRRFWEEDDDIYGGITHTAQPITQIVYPSDGFAGARGVLLGYYHFGESRRQLNDQPLAERERRSLEQGGLIHPQYPSEFENSFSVAWDNIEHSRMSWVQWNSGDEFERTLKALGEPDGPFYFAGDWLSHLNAWQAGAFASAQHVCRTLHARALSG